MRRPSCLVYAAARRSNKMALAHDPLAPRAACSGWRSGAERDPGDAWHDEPRRCLTPTSLWLRFKRLTQIGWPRRFPIVQFPNVPLIVAFLAGQAAMHTHGSSHAYASAIS
jgi:hypothetical protein